MPQLIHLFDNKQVLVNTQEVQYDCEITLKIRYSACHRINFYYYGHKNGRDTEIHNV